MQIHSVFYTSMLQQCNQFILLQITSMLVELKSEYKIKNILEKKIINEKAYYFVKWKDHSILKNI